MKRLISLALSLLLMLPLAVGAMAEDFDVTQHANPFSGYNYRESDFLGDGKIEVAINRDSPVFTDELTESSFPLLDVEKIIPDFDFFYIILKDKSEKAMVEAIDILYNNYRDIVNTADTRDSLMGLSTSIGDINGDHFFTLSDVTALLKHLAGWDVFIYTMHADVTHDTNINLADVTYILRSLAKWSDYSLGY